MSPFRRHVANPQVPIADYPNASSRHATPYRTYYKAEAACLRANPLTPTDAPIFLAQSKGFFADEGIQVAILEPNDPSDVTELIGSGAIDMGAKVGLLARYRLEPPVLMSFLS